ncbi:MAG: hypothetical protein V7707_11610, partial [Motiliproteus sp.]
NCHQLEYLQAGRSPYTDTKIGPFPVTANVDFNMQMAELGAGYTMAESASARWEVLGGLRWNQHDINVDVKGSWPIPDQMIGGGDEWYQAFVGGRVFTPLADNWTLIARSDVGYGGSDNSAFHLNVMVDYRFQDWGSAFGGYRYMKFDYTSNSYAYDATQQGPMLGVAIYW